MKNESLQNYDDSLFAKLVRKIASLGEKLPKLSQVTLSSDSINEELIEIFKEFLEMLDSSLVELKVKDKSLFIAIADMLEKGEVLIDFKDAEQEEFFELNPFVDFFIHKGEKYICINKDNMYIDNSISKYKILESLARSFIYFISDKTMYNKDFGFKYKWVNQAVNEMLVSYILNKEPEKSLKQIEVLERFLGYTKKYNKEKLFRAYLEGENSYLNKLIKEETLVNIDVILNSQNTASAEDIYLVTKHNNERLDKLFVEHVLKLNAKQIKDEKSLEYEKLYEKYFTLAKEYSDNYDFINKKVLQRILADASEFACKEKNSKDAVKKFLEFLNEDIIYREDYKTIEGKNLILKEILKIRSKYGENVDLENVEIFNAYIDAKNSLNKSKLDIEEETGRCIIKMCKDVKRIYKPKTIKNGHEYFTKDSLQSVKTGRKTTKQITFIYDGTIKDEKETQKICETKFNLSNQREKEKFEKMLLNKVIQYKEFTTDIKKEEEQKIEIYNKIFSDYISKYLSKRKSKLLDVGKKKEKDYNFENKKRDNTIIIQEIKKVPEDEFLENVEENTKNIIEKFHNLYEMYNGV